MWAKQSESECNNNNKTVTTGSTIADTHPYQVMCVAIIKPTPEQRDGAHMDREHDLLILLVLILLLLVLVLLQVQCRAHNL